MDTFLQGLAQAIRPYLVSEGAKQGMGYKHTATGTPITTGYSHGPGGVLTFPGVDPQVFHTAVGNIGILGSLPTKPSVFTNPTYETITGVQADASSTEKNGVCDDAIVAGLMKGCIVTSVFGRYERSTPEMEINRLGQRIDRADPMDLALVGTPFAGSSPFGNLATNATPGDILTNEISRKFFERNLSLHRLLSRQIWRGNPANNKAGGGYKELTGLSTLVNTGYKDAQTGTSCPSIDSQVMDFNNARIDAAGNGTQIVEAMAYLMNYLEALANDTGVAPVRWVIVMRDMLFFELTKVWPCSYLTTGCQVASGATLFVTADEQIRMRDDMRTNRYLMVNGRRYDVLLDDGISFDTNTTSASVTSGCERSDIYVLPMSVAGGVSTLFLEYFDYSNASMSSALEGNMILARVEGAFLTVPKQKNFCVQWQSKIEPRLVLRTPWLAGRIKNVQYCPLLQPRQPFPDDPYFVDGGVTSRSGPSYYRVWAS